MCSSAGIAAPAPTIERDSVNGIGGAVHGSVIGCGCQPAGVGEVRAARGMLPASRAVARLLRPGVQRWRAYWDVDHRAGNFYSPEEYLQLVEQKEQARNAAMATMLREHMKASVLPRWLDVQPGAASAGAGEAAPAAGGAAGAAGRAVAGASGIAARLMQPAQLQHEVYVPGLWAQRAGDMVIERSVSNRGLRPNPATRRVHEAGLHPAAGCHRSS
jgi:hypothetical protein